MDQETMDQARQAAARGATILDQTREDDWRSCIDPEQLDMGSSGWCVLGQLYSSYGSGLNIVHGGQVHRQWANDHGFTSESWVIEIALRVAWLEIIRAA